MVTDTYAEQGLGTAVVVVGHLAHGLVIVHGHSASKTQQAHGQKQAMHPPTGQTHQLFLKNVMYELFPGFTKAVVFAVWAVQDLAEQEIQALD